jgi:hypothetical protein
MILHFSHIGFTDGLTFMIPFRLVTATSCGCHCTGAATASKTRSQDDFLAREQDDG